MKSKVATVPILLAMLAVPIGAQETYRLVHAIGNKERYIAKGLSKAECESQKKEYAVIAAILVGGSVTCLPESTFSN